MADSFSRRLKCAMAYYDLRAKDIGDADTIWNYTSKGRPCRANERRELERRLRLPAGWLDGQENPFCPPQRICAILAELSQGTQYADEVGEYLRSISEFEGR